jgi:HTH-type transcriptional regulator/antitoxin HigA
MAAATYHIIQNDAQYFEYCNHLEELVTKESTDPSVMQETEQLSKLIEQWDRKHLTWARSTPIEALKYLMDEHDWAPETLATFLDAPLSLINDVLRYQQKLPEEYFGKLAAHFRVKPALFNRPYQLIETTRKNNNHVSLEAILAAGGPTVYAIKSGRTAKNLKKALAKFPKPEPFSDEEWDELMKQLERDK